MKYILEVFDSRNTSTSKEIEVPRIADAAAIARKISREETHFPVIIREASTLSHHEGTRQVFSGAFRQYENGILTEWSSKVLT